MYREFLETLTEKDVMSDILDFFNELMDNNIKIAIASISQNELFILEKLNLNINKRKFL